VNTVGNSVQGSRSDLGYVLSHRDPNNQARNWTLGASGRRILAETMMLT
jgi:hypothetical protein